MKIVEDKINEYLAMGFCIINYQYYHPTIELCALQVGRSSNFLPDPPLCTSDRVCAAENDL